MTLLEPLRRPVAQILAPCLATHAKRWGLVREPPTRTVHFGMIFSEEACKCPNCPTCNGEHDVSASTPACLAGPRVATPMTTTLFSVSVAYDPSQGRAGRLGRPSRVMRRE